LFVSTNGLITFGTGNTAFSNADLTTSPTQAAISPFWDDLIVTGATNSAVRYQVLGTGTSTHLVIEWVNASFFADSTRTGGLTFEAVLGVDGSVRFNYQSIATGHNNGLHDLGAHATVGVKDAGTQGPNRLLVVFNNGPTALLNNQKSIVISPPAATAAADYYSFTLGAAETDTFAVTALAPGNVGVELVDGHGSVLAAGVAGATNLSNVISNFDFVLNPGTYYARVTGDAGLPYSLVVTRKAAFDTEPNNSSATAQNIDGLPGVLGAISQAAGNSVVPNVTTNTEGDFFDTFVPSDLGTPSMHYQQIYSASQFSAGGVISAIRFWRDGSQAPFSMSNIDIQINLAYSARTVATASANFSDNIGSGFVTVFDGLLNLTSTSTSSPRAFDLVIPVASLFNYVPSRGDLLLDIRLRNTPTTGGQFDLSGYLQQTVTTRIYGGLTSATGTVGYFGQGPMGLVTRFDLASTLSSDWYAIDLTSTSNLLSLATSTPAGGPGEFVNNLVPMLELYDPFGTLVATGTVGPDGRNQVLQYLASVPGTYRIHVFAQGNTSGVYFLSATTVGQSPNASVSSIAQTIIDDGTAQRSMVRSITLDFNGTVVSSPSSAFTLTRTEDGLVVPVIASALTPLPGGKTQVTLTFGGPSLDAGSLSLSDGFYTLSIDGSQIIDSNGNMLDAANNGTAGSMGTVSFFRFFGDFNGDGFVTAADFLVFRAAYLSGDTTAYNSIFDFDGSGMFTIVDLEAFTKNFLKRQLT
jgi:hypothetical protein